MSSRPSMRRATKCASQILSNSVVGIARVLVRDRVYHRTSPRPGTAAGARRQEAGTARSISIRRYPLRAENALPLGGSMERELKLECLKLASGLPDGTDVVGEATRYWEFISSEYRIRPWA